MAVRPPVVAGSFYPADPSALADLVDRLLASAPGPTQPPPTVLVVPHAGYRFSGPVAATGYAQLAARAGWVRRVVLLGPAHFVPLSGLATSSAAAWGTPLGVLPVESVPVLAVDDAAHTREHALEVQLPFLQRIGLSDASIVPVAVGVSGPAAVADALDGLCDPPGTLLLVSTDLSHYQKDASARAQDRRTADAVLRADPASIGWDDACGVYALRGLLTWCARHGRRLRELDLRTSADTCGDRARVVGYGAFAG